jgi:hypothetical protein
MRNLTHFALFGFLAGCAAHADPAPPSAPEKDPSVYPSTTAASGTVSQSDSASTPSGGSNSAPATSSQPVYGSSTVVSPGVATAAIDTNLDRLKALQIFEVGGLLLTDIPPEANCYGSPCAGKEQVWANAKEAQARRLADFTDTAVTAASLPVTYDVVAPEASEQNLSVLRSLEIVGIGSLIVAKPAANGNCYGPCPDEIAACNAINDERAHKLANIAKSF